MNSIKLLDINLKQFTQIALICIPFIVIAVYLGIVENIGLPILFGIAGVPIILLSIKFPKLWMYFFATSLIVFFRESSQTVDTSDILLGLYLNGGLVLWFFNSLFIKRIKIVRNVADWLFLFLFFMLLFNALIAYLNDVELGYWVREYLLLTFTLYFFPIREILKDKSDLKKFLIFFAFTIFIGELVQFYDYYNKLLTNLIYVYELGRSVGGSQTLFTTAGIFGFIFLFSQTNKKHELLLLLFTATTIAALITTFSRTFWIIELVAVVSIFLFLPTKKKLLFLNYFVLISIVIFLSISLLMKDNSKFLLLTFTQRLTSSKSGVQDISVLSRFDEWQKVSFHIKENPLAGNGLHKNFRFFNRLDKYTSNNNIIHNGYLFLIYRTGFPLTFIYFFFLIYYTFVSFLLIFKIKDEFLKPLILGSFISLTAFFIINFTSSQVSYRTGVFVVAFVIAFISITKEFYQSTSQIEIIESNKL